MAEDPYRTAKAVPATRRTPAQDEPQPRQKATSISAHVTMMGTVTMSFTELETLAEMVSRVTDANHAEQLVADEFIDAVRGLR